MTQQRMNKTSLSWRSPWLAPGDAGVSLISVMMGVVITGIMAAVISTQMVNSGHMSKKTDLDVDMSAAKMNIIQQLDCPATIQSKTACKASDTFVLKKRDGTQLFPGNKAADWIMQGYCVKNVLMVRATTAHLHPIYQKIVTKDDIFQGAAGLCAGYFGASPGDPCKAKPEIKGGVTYDTFGGKGQPCCRKQAADNNANETEVIAWCTQGKEALMNGGGRCTGAGQTNPSDYRASDGSYVFLHVSQRFVDPLAPNHEGWEVDCQSAPNAMQSHAHAVALCCPYN